MATRKINWTKEANFERKEILVYWINRNKSKSYSIKLNKLFINTLKQISDNPKIGRKTDFGNVRVKIVRDYLLFYEFDIKQIKVLSLWDGRRDDNTIPLK
ncbi:type II toxin-antitoxin system RelE/ParE family toxin [Kaistella flava (ex Peng et al. 2021)]|uniref:Type II toxin-antitoxin system RelE/ParE family toxin n=1 Tax=Kaistella flava (ex Peng et al. 2021) TaxID=2038776 RepID=A0A7M2YDL7_9FLAO|nr:type II toxin-antitoxin system RelE/ParE family toxin [Kaistella flava (ex Peng et al. 2021)]QOW11552.1 type II toxin-antitoxin system RelE/ParE family toxin [Kaistella flava (ex Peng et al. 2021)]